MKLSRKIFTYVIIALLALVCALSYQLFVFPNRFAPAGLNGICTMIQHITGISVGYLSLVINIPLAAAVLFKVGRSLALRSLVYTACFSLSLILLQRVDLSRFAYETVNGTSKILGPVTAGIINGACCAPLIAVSASSGGTDLIAALIHRYRPERNFFVITFILNALVAVSSYFVYDFEMEPVLLCILYCFISGTVTDRLMKNSRRALRCEIMTDSPEELSAEIMQHLHHGVTLIPGRGMYSGREISVLVCVVNKSQAAAIAAIVRRHGSSFAVMSPVTEVMGNFKRMSTRGREEKQILDIGDGKSV